MNTEIETAATETADTVVHADTSAVVEGAVTEATNTAAEATPTVKPAKVKGVPGRPRVAGSALSRARSIYAANPTAARADIVAKFVADGISKPIANTYFHLIQKSNKR